jgi:hypothetical protein
MNKRFYTFLIVAIFGGLLIWTNACKEPEPPKAMVIVVDESGDPVEGAMVVVKAADSDSSHTVVYLANGPKQIADTAWSNSDGKVNYDFRYEAIYKVEVTKGTDRDHPFVRRGLGVLILENDKVYEEQITINEQTVFN